MRNILLTVAYKGTMYAGWQIQENAETVQGKLMEALFHITGEKVTLYASGRTDAGVHAAAQTVNFWTESNMSAEKFAAALNTKLPWDISVLKSKEAAPDFHARFSAHHKTYCYRVYCSETINPLLDEYAWHLRLPKRNGGVLNIDEMKKAAASFIGNHDFSGFMSTGSPVLSTVREIYALEIEKKETAFFDSVLYEITITGNGFLYNMVRIIAGTLVEIGKNEISAEKTEEILLSKNRKLAGVTAPAKGLMLMNVAY